MEQPRIPFARVNCSGNELKYVTEVLESGWLTTASKAKKLEKKFQRYLGVKHACAVNSGTAALHLALEALGISPGDKVILPTMTFTASAEVVRYLGADPVLTDVEYGTCLITPGILKEAVLRCPNAKAVIIVHYSGQSADMIGDFSEGILDICRNNGISIVEDAAHAFPTYFQDRLIGGIGDVTCFSFYANKTITTGEGGMLTTNNSFLAERVKKMRLHGISSDVWDRYTSGSASWEYDVIAPGFKYNMPDINAAIGLAQLEKAEEFRRQRERCARYYFQNLKNIQHLDLPVVRNRFQDHAWHLFPIVIGPRAPMDRNSFIKKMSELGIGLSVHYKPIHRLSYYKKKYNLIADDYPMAEKIWRGCVSLPIYPTLTEKELSYICSSVKNLMTH